jgi:GNAT superfamily N-acetyltransferase
MPKLTEDLYRVQTKDVDKAGAVLMDAFQKDPLWIKVFRDISVLTKDSFFGSSVRYGYKYGSAYAPSEKLEGVAVWVREKFADMTLWRMLRTGAMKSLKDIGIIRGIRFYRKMAPVFAPIEKDRKKNMKGRLYFYLMIIGVAPDYQGKGLGGKMLRALFEESETAGIPVYLETETETNVVLYEKLGFRVMKKIVLPVIDLPLWEMIREPF